jgi:hypothetical protein
MCEGGHGTAGQVSPMTTDQPGICDGYATANLTERAAIAEAVYEYVAGFMWFLAHDESVPEATRNSTLEYGLCGDTTPYWPDGWPTLMCVGCCLCSCSCSWCAAPASAAAALPPSLPPSLPTSCMRVHSVLFVVVVTTTGTFVKACA